MNEQSPIRWRDPGSDVGEGLRYVMDSASLDEAGAAQLARLTSRFETAIGAGPSATSVGPSVWPSAKVLASMVAVVGGTALVWMLAGPGPQPERDGPSGRPAVGAVAVPRSPHADSAAPQQLAATQVEAAPQDLPSAPDDAEINDVSGEGSTTGHAAAGPSRRPLDDADSLAEEVRLLQAVRARLRGDPGGALRIAEVHQTRFPRGTLAQEREALAIEALLQQGRRADAQGRAERFHRRWPRASHLDRLTELSDTAD